MEETRGCNPQECKYHMLTDSVINDLREAVNKLTEGQDQMRETVIQLTEAFKLMGRVDQRVDKLEDLQREKDKDQDAKIQELRGFMYKAVGIAIGASGALGYLLQFLGM